MSSIDQALRIQELDAEVAQKDYALAAAERMSTEGAKERQKLVAQLSQAEVEKFDCIRKLPPTVGWPRGALKKEILAAIHRAKNFDAYSDRKLYHMYDNLFEKECPYIMKIASGYRHTIADLLKVHLDPAPSGGTSAPTLSKALDGSSLPPN
ncbi:hypothetical protein Tco_0391136 [Tanacetum coccineum]